MLYYLTYLDMIKLTCQNEVAASKCSEREPSEVEQLHARSNERSIQLMKLKKENCINKKTLVLLNQQQRK